MKKIALIGLSVFTLLVSCKCKKAVTNEVVMTSPETEIPVVGSTDSSALQTDVTNSSNKQEMKNGVEYTANTRGYHLKIKWDGAVLGYTNQRDSEEFTKVTLTKTQVDELNSLFKTLPYEKLSELKAPTQKRQYDGAPHGDMKLIVDGKEYNSAGFDHGYPPAEIEKFVKKLLSYTEEK